MGSGRASSTGAPIYVGKHCHKVSRDIARVDAWVIGLVIDRLSRPDAADLLIATERADLASLRDRAVVLRARQEEAAALFADGAITALQLRVTTAKIAAMLGEVESRRRRQQVPDLRRGDRRR